MAHGQYYASYRDAIKASNPTPVIGGGIFSGQWPDVSGLTHIGGSKAIDRGYAYQLADGKIVELAINQRVHAVFNSKADWFAYRAVMPENIYWKG